MIKYPLITAFISVLACSRMAVAEIYTFTKIVDTSTPIPGTGGVYTSFDLPTADRENDQFLDGGNFFFQAQSSNGASGVYHFMVENLFPTGTLSSLTRIADTTMAAPTGGTFANFSSVTSGWGAMGFIGQGSNGAQGVYEADIGNPDFNFDTLRLVAQPGDSPISGVTFGDFQGLSLMGYGQEGAGFGDETRGEILSSTGVYDFDLGFAPNITVITFQRVIAAGSTPAGASGPFSEIGPPSFKGPRLSDIQGITTDVSAFRATAGGIEGIYYNYKIGGGNPQTPNLKLLVSTATPSIQNFTSFGDPVASSDEIAFTAHYNTLSGDQQGIFSYGEYQFRTNEEFHINPPVAMFQISATGDIAPGTPNAHFVSFGNIALKREGGGYFIATLDNGIEGLYQFDDLDYELGAGSIGISDVLNTGNILDNKTISDIEMSPEGVGEQIAVCKIDFSDGSQGIYYFTASVPEPAFLTFPLGFAWLFSRRRRLLEPHG